jgi:hypothetical protein
VTHASASNALKLRDGLMAVAEWEAEQGAFAPEELGAARRRIGVRDAGSDANCTYTCDHTASDLG